MKQNKRIVLLLVSLIMTLTALPLTATAAGVNVTIPSFSVTLNGTKMDNTYSQYPLIVYKDITYFPMTYYDCRFLGLETDWNQAEGLKIVKTGTSWEYTPYTTTAKNGRTYQASTAQGAISVNGEAIDNNKETYPLLVFRNVTYFPLTWRFAVDSFGWEYNFDNTAGLVIQSAGASIPGSSSGSGGTSLVTSGQEVILPIVYLGEYAGFGGFAKHNGYYYYQGENGAIYQAEVSNPQSRKQLHQTDAVASTERKINIFVQNNKVMAQYQMGSGPTMGSHMLLHLKENGTAEEIKPASKYWDYREFSDLSVVASHSVPATPANLAVKLSGETAYKTLGDDLFYASFNENTGFRQGDDLYVIGTYSEFPWERTTPRCLYQVNYKTNKVTKVIDAEPSQYVMNSKTIYYSGEDNKGLYRYSLSNGKTETLLADTYIENMIMVGDSLFYITKFDGLLYRYGNSSTLNPDSIATEMTMKGGYLYVRFSSGPYKIMVFDQSGNVMAKTIENIVDILMEDGKAIFVKNQ